MIKAIVYKSSTGHTLEYAKMLSRKLNIPYYTIKEANKHLTRNESIIYLGWICAGRICGLSKVKKQYNIKCLGMVGVYPESEEYKKSLRESNDVKSELFYLQGGINYNKLKGIKRSVIQIVGKAITKENKPENKELIEAFKMGKSFVSEKNLEKMVQYIKEE